MANVITIDVAKVDKAGKTIITAKSGEAEDSVEFEVLEDAQIIETKNTYIIGTQIKCKHFKIRCW